jgi:hypothetical protein
MDAALITAIAALVAAPVTAAAAMYGQRGANRTARETGALTGYDALANRLVAERDKAETDQVAAEARASAADAQTSALRAENARLQAENERLRAYVAQLGGQLP